MKKETKTVLEKDVKFSNSKLWNFQTYYYDKEGMNSWTGPIPSYVTSNCVTANTYVETFIGYLKDNIETGLINTKEKITLIELGAGSGKFAFLFLHHLEKALKKNNLEHLKIEYVLTDFTEKILNYFQSQVQFQYFEKKGMLDYALYDGQNPGPLTLLKSKEVLEKNKRKNPITLFANYLFDSLPHDAFQINQTEIKEGLLTTKLNKNDIKDDKILSLESLETKFKFNPITLPYYTDDTLNEVLKKYQHSLLLETVLDIPVNSIACLNHLETLSENGYFLICADKGFPDEFHFEGIDNIQLQFHGTFSLTTNLDAISKYIQLKGGDSLLPQDNAGLKVCVFWSKKPTKRTETENNYTLLNGSLAPASFVERKEKIETEQENYTLEELLIQLQLSNEDPEFLQAISKRLKECIQTQANSPKSLRILKEILKSAKEKVYLFAHQSLELFEIGVLYFELKEYQSALECYQNSKTYLMKADPAHEYNIALCHYQLKDFEKALLACKEALKIDNEYTLATTAIELIEKEKGIITLESQKRLSLSKLWKYQENFFKEKGLESWKDSVPFYATSNAIIAKNYAQILIEYLREGLQNKEINPKDPIYILELGTGSGKFSFLFLTEFEELKKTFGLTHLNIIYLITDFTPIIINELKKQPQLNAFVEKGMLDFAVYNCNEEKDLFLEQSKTTLKKKSLKNRIIVIANYLFDTLKHDAFEIKDKVLYETQLTLKTHKDNQTRTGVKSLKEISYEFNKKKITHFYYPSKQLNTLLKNYENEFQTETHFTIPIGAINCINHLETLSQKGLFLILTDKANTQKEELEGRKGFPVAEHGSISITLNAHSLLEYFKLKNGETECANLSTALQSALCFSQSKTPFHKTKTKYLQIENRLSSLAFIQIHKKTVNSLKTLSINDLESLLDLSYFDPTFLSKLAPSLIEKLNNNLYNKDVLVLYKGLKIASKKVYELPYPHKEYFEIGRLYYLIKEYTLAETYFEKSKNLYFKDDSEHDDWIKKCKEQQKKAFIPLKKG